MTFRAVGLGGIVSLRRPSGKAVLSGRLEVQVVGVKAPPVLAGTAGTGGFGIMASMSDVQARRHWTVPVYPGDFMDTTGRPFRSLSHGDDPVALRGACALVEPAAVGINETAAKGSLVRVSPRAAAHGMSIT